MNVALLLPLSLLFSSVQDKPAEKNKESAELGFISLFNGKDLAGWVVMGDKTWKVEGDKEDSRIVCSGGHGGWLRSEKEYEDFIWKLEYRVAKEGGNSGMFLRATEQGNPAFTGMEVQILADRGKQPDVHSSCSLYGSVAPKKNVAKPAGEWNTVEIRCIGRHLEVTMNGEKVQDINLDDKTLPYQEKPVHERVKKGFIGVQNHEDRVEFRNLWIKTVKPTEKSAG